MNDVTDQSNQTPSYVNFGEIFYSPQFAAGCFNLTTRRLKDIEEQHGINIRRVARGNVPTRSYTSSDIFDIAALRRSLGQSKGIARQFVIATFVQKGGTGKTTEAVNLALFLQLAGLKVLIIDNDPQGDTSSMLGFDPDLGPEDLEDMQIPHDRLVDGHVGNVISPLLRMRAFETKQLSDVIKKPFGENGPHLLPADSSLEDLGVALDAADNSDMWYATWIEAANSGRVPSCDLSVYDVIIFDNAPSGSRLTKNSVAASDLLLCPVRMDKFSFRALLRLHEWCARFAQAYRRAPAITAVPTMFIRNRSRLESNLAMLNDMFPGQVTDERIYYSEDYSKAMEEGVPLLLWKGAGNKTVDTARAVYGEILSKIRALTKSE